MKTINIRIFYWQQMRNTATNTVTPLGAPFLRTTQILYLFIIKLVYSVLILTFYTERRLIEPRLSALAQAALVYMVRVYTEWQRS